MVYSALSNSTTRSQFTRRKGITITTNGTSTPINYQCKLTITHEAEMQADFDDIRFNTKAGGYIDYLIESYTASTTATIWIKLSDAITDPGSDYVWMYYGNSGLSDGSNGIDTFLAFFDGDSTGWTEVDPNSHITFQNNRLEFSGLHRGEDAYVYQSFTSSEWVCEEAYAITAATAGSILISPATTDEIDDMAGTANAAFTQYYSGAYSRVGLRISSTTYNGGDQTIPTGTYYLRTTKNGNTITTNWYSDSARTNQVYTSTVTQAGLPSLSYIYMLNTWNSGNSEYTISGWIDDFNVREYIANEPIPSYGTAQHQRKVPQFIG